MTFRSCLLITKLKPKNINMQNLIKLVLIVTLNLCFQFHLDAQARLVIENNSQRFMTVKVMKSDTGNGTLHKLVEIPAHSSETIYFSETGYYFTKTKAVLSGKKPACKKGETFRVYNGSDGYSVLTLTFTIIESNVLQSTGGKQISEKEFDQN